MGKNTDFTKKHPEGAVPDVSIRTEIEKRLKGNQLPCAVAFKIAKDIGRSPKEVGQTADLLGVRLSKCKLGLFGYSPKKKIVDPAEEVDVTLREALSKAVKGEKLSCESAWRIADAFGISKMSVSAACEAMKIKITACQLDAF